ETSVQDCPPDSARDAAALLVRQTLAVTQQPVRAAAWHDLPTTYVVCTEDRGTSAAAQREFSRRADKVIEVNAGHHPFLSQPQTVADIIASLSSPRLRTWCGGSTMPSTTMASSVGSPS